MAKRKTTKEKAPRRRSPERPVRKPSAKVSARITEGRLARRAAAREREVSAGAELELPDEMTWPQAMVAMGQGKKITHDGMGPSWFELVDLDGNQTVCWCSDDSEPAAAPRAVAMMQRDKSISWRTV
jgi:hypothetical protein